jgi:RND family efflux transporter MFP subunit
MISIESNSEEREARNPLPLPPSKPGPSSSADLGQAGIQPKSNVLTLIAVVLAMLILGATAGWFVRGMTGKDERVTLEDLTDPHDPKAIAISTSTVSYRQLKRSIEAVGSIHAFEELTVAAKTDGRVLRIHHDMAEVVGPNSLLLEMDPTDLQLTLSQAERSLKAECVRWGFEDVPDTSADLDKLPSVRSSKMRLELAQSKLARLNELMKSNSVSMEEFDQVRSEARIAESDWDDQRFLARSALATILLRESELNIVRQRLKDTQVLTPIPTLVIRGEDPIYRIAQRLVSEGMLVRPGDLLFKLVLGNSVKVRLTLPETSTSQIVEGQSVEIETFSSDPAIAGLGESVVTGVVTRVSPVIDPATRTLLVEVEVVNQEGKLKPGGFARARIFVGRTADAMTVPLAALDTFAGINKIFVVANGVATEHQVKLGYQQDDWVEVTEPRLPHGTVIATSSQRLLSTGVSVLERKVQPESLSDKSGDTQANSPDELVPAPKATTP